MKCPYCRHEIPDGELVCPRCWAEIPKTNDNAGKPASNKKTAKSKRKTTEG